MNNVLIVANSVGCFIIGYVTLGLLIQMRTPMTWKGWLERAAMAAVVGASVFAGITPLLLAYLPMPWTLTLNLTIAAWFWLMFHRTTGWKKHISDNFDDISEFLKKLPSRVDHAKLCWNERVDRVRAAK